MTGIAGWSVIQITMVASTFCITELLQGFSGKARSGSEQSKTRYKK